MSFSMTQAHSPATARVSHGVASTTATHNEAAATPMINTMSAAVDEVSALTAARFVMHARNCREMSAQAAAVRPRSTTTLTKAADSHAAAAAANAVAAG
jgi:hypothetical protein